jgi:hypothetical protein
MVYFYFSNTYEKNVVNVKYINQPYVASRRILFDKMFLALKDIYNQ